jgi:DNA-binding response OmpR family regulator
MKSLLFIDDEPELLNVWKRYFSARNYRVLTAPAGLKGLKLAEREKPDLIVLDLKMPGLSGLETLQRLRKRDKKTKVIIMTAYGTADFIRACSELGISDFISKPFDLKILLKVIEEALPKESKDVS